MKSIQKNIKLTLEFIGCPHHYKSYTCAKCLREQQQKTLADVKEWIAELGEIIIHHPPEKYGESTISGDTKLKENNDFKRLLAKLEAGK